MELRKSLLHAIAMNSPRRKSFVTASVRRTVAVAALLGTIGSILAFNVLALLRGLPAFSRSITWREDLLLQSTKIDPDWIEADEYYRRTIGSEAPSIYRKRCEQILNGTHGFDRGNKDVFIFHEFFKPLREPGIYLQIGSRAESVEGSSTAFLDICLGWKGVVVNIETDDKPSVADHEEKYRSYRKVPLRAQQSRRDGAEGSGAPVVNLLEVLSDQSDVLGKQDLLSGKFGEKINYVAVDLDGAETVRLVGCTDLKGLFSRSTKIQVWSIRTNRLSGIQMKMVDAAMMLAGYVKASPILDDNGRFMDDIYVLMSNVVGDSYNILEQHRCKNWLPSCSLASIMKASKNPQLAEFFKC